MPRRTPSSIDFSRSLGVSETTAIGLSVCLPVAIFIAGDLILESAGADAPLLFALAAILFLPIILTYCELAVGVPGSASAYRIARASGSASRAFGVGWLMLGGLMALAAALIEEEARRFSMMLEHLVDVPYPLVVFTVMVAFLAAANQWLVREDRWRIRTALVWIAGISMVGLLMWVLILRPSDFATLPDASIDKHDRQKRRQVDTRQTRSRTDRDLFRLGVHQDDRPRRSSYSGRQRETQRHGHKKAGAATWKSH